MDWGHEWLTSLVWVAEVSAYTLVAFVLIVLLLMRLTHWGRQFRTLTFPYFVPHRTLRSWLPLLTVLLIIVLNVIDVRVAVLNSDASNSAASAIQDLNASVFWRFTIIGAIVAVVYVVNAAAAYLAGQAFAIRWRVWLTDHVLNDWLDGQAYYRGRFVGSGADNPDQRIEQDIGEFVDLSQQLAFDTVNQVNSLWSFTLILWTLSGPMSIFGAVVPKAIVFIVFIYVAATSLFAFRIGRPLIRLLFRQERLSASFRYGLVRLRENSESVAFYRGEAVERATLGGRFARLISTTWQVTFRTTWLNGFNKMLDQIATVAPFVLQAPRIFSGTIKLGDAVQTLSAMGNVNDAFSYFRNAYKDFARYRAAINRLSGLREANAQARTLPMIRVDDRAEGLSVERLTIELPSRRQLITDLQLELRTGDRLLVKGPSGTGKTTLLRSLAGLWPYADGAIARPTGQQALFLSQQPYLPLGGLRTALAYPNPPQHLDGQRAAEVLFQVQLPHLVGRLDEETDWSSTLSPGEQQRIGFARLLLAQPKIAFLDESTSALDEGIEHTLYQLLRDRLPDCVLVSVGHRTTLHQLHTHHLDLRPGGEWSLSTPVPIVSC